MVALPKAESFIDALRASALGVQIVSEIDKTLVAQRTLVANKLAEAHAEIELTYPGLQAEVEKAQKEHRDAAEKLQAAASKLNAAVAARSAASHEYSGTCARLENELAESASPAIDDFVKWARGEIHDLPKHFRVQHSIQTTIAGPRERVQSNKASIEKRRAALALAIEAAQAMKLIPDQGQAPQALDALRAGIPNVEMDI